MNEVGRAFIEQGAARRKRRHRVLLAVMPLAAAGVIAVGFLERRGAPQPDVRGNETMPLVTTVAMRRPTRWCGRWRSRAHWSPGTSSRSAPKQRAAASRRSWPMRGIGSSRARSCCGSTPRCCRRNCATRKRRRRTRRRRRRQPRPISGGPTGSVGPGRSAWNRWMSAVPPPGRPPPACSRHRPRLASCRRASPRPNCARPPTV